jgi:peptidase S46-like protein
MRTRLLVALLVVVAAVAVGADEGMWRIAQLPVNTIAQKYGVRLTPADLERLQSAPVRILSGGGGGGTGTFASPNGLILTNHHVALDCIRTSTLAEQNKGKADNLIEQGFTAKAPADELACKRFRVQIERTARDVTAELNADVKPGMSIPAIQQVRQRKRADLERTCKEEKGANFSCAVVDFNSGAWSQLITYEDFNDVRLVYAPEKQLGYFGGDEMNFRFPRYVSDISILRAYVGKDGSHGEFDAAHVPYKPAHHLHVTFDGVKEGDFTIVAGNPGTTNRYRISESAVYNVKVGMPQQIRDIETELALLRKYAALKSDYQVLLQERIFGLANTLKYLQDVHAALSKGAVAAQQQARERQFMAFLQNRPDLQKEYGALFDDHRRFYATAVEANADLDSALDWIEKPSAVGYATTLYEFALERSKPSDREREPQFQERNWADLRQGLLNEEPTIPELEEDLLTIGFEKALALPKERQIAAVSALVVRAGTSDPRALARAILRGSKIEALETRKALIEAAPQAFEQSTDQAVQFGRELLPAIRDRRSRVRVLNETLFQHRSKFARGLAEWKGQTLYPDANFTLRVTYGAVAGYKASSGTAVPFTTYFGDMFKLAAERGNKGDFALPPALVAWRNKIGDRTFAEKFARLPVDFVSTNDITGGNSGSSTLNRRLEIVGLIFDGNEEAMASDWAYSEVAGRALSTDIRFALTIAREVHGAGWVVDELMAAVPATAGR